ncbi:MAG: DUF4926 domain-containing protein [Terriglobales bacterium]
MSTFEMHDVVRLKADIKDMVDTLGKTVSLPRGTIGTIVMMFPGQYEVEFCEGLKTVALMTLPENLLEKAT